MFEAFPALIPMLFDFVTGDNTQTDLQTSLFTSGVSSKRSFTIFTLYSYTVIQGFKSCDLKDFKHQLNTCHVLLLW